MRILISSVLLTCLLAYSAFAQEVSPEISSLRDRANKGDVRAQVQLGRAYEDGAGVPQNDVEALKWYRKAAEAGDPAAQASVGFAYRSGLGVEKDYPEAMRWYSLAAKQGNANAMFNLATFYYNGDGVRIDDVQACAWFWLAKAAGSKVAEDAVERTEKELSSGRLSDAKLLMADMLAEGKDVPRDSTTALAIYEEAGKYGQPEVQMKLAKLFLNGWGVPRDPGKTETYCRKALNIEKLYTPAMICLAYLNQSGLLGSDRGKEAFTWYEKAFKLGNPVAAYGLGVAYATGQGVQQDFEKAFNYLVMASLANIEVATPLAKQVEQKLAPDVARKLVKKANDVKKARGIYTFGLLDKQFSYVVKVDHLP